MVQQLRATVTQHSILRAAAEIFDARGYDAATINDVVLAAGCTKGALYFHFPSKESLADAIIAEQSSWLNAAAGAEGDPLQQMIDVAFAFATALQDDVILRASIRLTVETGTFDGRTTKAYQLWSDAVLDLLKSARTQGLLLDGKGLPAVAECITGCITGIQLTSEALTGRADLHRRLTLMWRLLLPSLVPAVEFARLRVTPQRVRAAAGRH